MTVPTSGYLIEDNWRLAGVGVQVGEVVGGDAQIVAGPTPWWTANFTYVVPKAAHLEWEGWLESMRGQLIADAFEPTPDRLMHGVPTTWTGGTFWTGNIGWGPTTEPRLTASALQFAGSIEVDHPSEFQAGRFFFIDGHCYRTTKVDGGTISFRPGLRKPALVLQRVTGTGTVAMYSAETDFPEFTRTAQGAHTITLRMKERINDAA